MRTRLGVGALLCPPAALAEGVHRELRKRVVQEVVPVWAEELTRVEFHRGREEHRSDADQYHLVHGGEALH